MLNTTCGFASLAFRGSRIYRAGSMTTVVADVATYVLASWFQWPGTGDVATAMLCVRASTMPHMLVKNDDEWRRNGVLMEEN